MLAELGAHPEVGARGDGVPRGRPLALRRLRPGRPGGGRAARGAGRVAAHHAGGELDLGAGRRLRAGGAAGAGAGRAPGGLRRPARRGPARSTGSATSAVCSPTAGRPGLARRAMLEVGRRLRRGGQARRRRARRRARHRARPARCSSAAADPTRPRWPTGSSGGRRPRPATSLSSCGRCPPRLRRPTGCLRPPAGRRGGSTSSSTACSASRRRRTPRPSSPGSRSTPGCTRARPRLVDSAADFDRIKQGDVLVTRMTSPYFNVVLPMLGAIVTDRGGQLCHAAIVAREYGIPGIVGNPRRHAQRSRTAPGCGWTAPRAKCGCWSERRPATGCTGRAGDRGRGSRLRRQGGPARRRARGRSAGAGWLRPRVGGRAGGDGSARSTSVRCWSA